MEKEQAHVFGGGDRQGPDETTGRGVQSYSQTGDQSYTIQSNDVVS